MPGLNPKDNRLLDLSPRARIDPRVSQPDNTRVAHAVDSKQDLPLFQ